MTRHDFLIKTIIMMAANSAYKYNWHSRHEWANTIIDAATLLADMMEKRKIFSPE